ncbi:MAG: hypothetical protein JWQ70_1118 [Aeromicrobium sp.]|nr:hypothetical protein [Aeromicrobium sp.]
MRSDPQMTWIAPPAVLPLHPRARAALVLGIVSALGALFLLPALLGPLGWYYGAVARRDIEREPTRWGGHRDATIGMTCGIIGTALLALALLVAAIAIGGYALLLDPQSGYGS